MNETIKLMGFAALAAISIGNVITLYEKERYRKICYIGIFGIPAFLFMYFMILSFIPMITDDYKKMSFKNKVNVRIAFTIFFFMAFREAIVVFAEGFLKVNRSTASGFKAFYRTFRNFLRKEYS